MCILAATYNTDDDIALYTQIFFYTSYKLNKNHLNNHNNLSHNKKFELGRPADLCVFFQIRMMLIGRFVPDSLNVQYIIRCHRRLITQRSSDHKLFLSFHMYSREDRYLESVLSHRNTFVQSNRFKAFSNNWNWLLEIRRLVLKYINT